MKLPNPHTSPPGNPFQQVVEEHRIDPHRPPSLVQQVGRRVVPVEDRPLHRQWVEVAKCLPTPETQQRPLPGLIASNQGVWRSERHSVLAGQLAVHQWQPPVLTLQMVD